MTFRTTHACGCDEEEGTEWEPLGRPPSLRRTISGEGISEEALYLPTPGRL